MFLFVKWKEYPPSYPITERESHTHGRYRTYPYAHIADAIRVGVTIRPAQAFGLYFGIVDGQLASCALGAALNGGVETMAIPYWLVSKIINRNDRLHWSREKIADWVESITRTRALFYRLLG